MCVCDCSKGAAAWKIEGEARWDGGRAGERETEREKKRHGRTEKQGKKDSASRVALLFLTQNCQNVDAKESGTREINLYIRASSLRQ